jgi:hypothetical protein
MLQPFARFNTAIDHEHLIVGLTKERELRQQISKLKQHKLNGFTRFANLSENFQPKSIKSNFYNRF